jgi:FkbM family methyltransferase
MYLTTRQKMAGARVVQRPVLTARRLARRGPVLRARRAGVTWELDLREGIDFSIWVRGYFEPATVKAYRRLLRSGSTALDVGANVGAHTLHLARAVGATGRVVAFEPAGAAFERLTTNISLNDDLGARICARQTMLLRAPDDPLPPEVISSWPLVPGRELHPTVPGRPHSTAGARVETLDGALEALDVRSVDLIKLDVDGYECDVLAGATETLAQHRPTLLVELAPFLLETSGRLRGHKGVDAQDMKALARRNASMNVIARPA